VEVDGGVHEIDAVALRDAERQTWLVGRGYRVLRIGDAQAIVATEAAVAAILAAAGASTPTPDPSSQGGGEREGRSES
jgi:very-short-patch-repair endonuclease